MMVLPYGWIPETRACRRSSVPASVVNAHGRVRYLRIDIYEPGMNQADIERPIREATRSNEGRLVAAFERARWKRLLRHRQINTERRGHRCRFSGPKRRSAHRGDVFGSRPVEGRGSSW